MLSRRNTLTAVAASLVAVLGLAVGGARNPLRADDSGPCVIGGNGPLCYTIQVQTCLEWVPAQGGAGLTGISGGITCAKWETRTTYYYKDLGSGGGVTFNPRFK